ncbi:hypothetical protein D0T57_10560 [Dysgonomonas sp. 511]|nr:hypothetical protein [Dysgonomonas sp. 511]
MFIFLSLIICYPTDKFQIFYCFTGLAYIDIKNLRQEDIQLGFDNKVWIMTKREKTNINVNVPLLEIPRKILAKYTPFRSKTNLRLSVSIFIPFFIPLQI